jgi:hypothetical protein
MNNRRGARLACPQLEAPYRVVNERQWRRHGAGILGPSQVAGILVERTENKNLTATVTPADQAPDLAGIWGRLADKPKPDPEIHPIAHQA